jgi:hypothetical protein
MIQIPGNLRIVPDAVLATLADELGEAWRNAVASSRSWPGSGDVETYADAFARVRTEMDRRVTP